ncbi:MAG: hypothetical protein AABW61_01485 [Candidatus Aenigmatarchaeota archaeon]
MPQSIIFYILVTLAGFLGSGIWGGIAAIFEVDGLVFAVVGTVLVGYEALVER